MKINQLIAGAALTVLVALQTWTLKSVVELQVKVGALTQRLDDTLPQPPVRLSSNQNKEQ